MANDGTIDYSAVTMEINKTALIKAILPQLVVTLANNPLLLAQLTAAVTTALALQNTRKPSAVNTQAISGALFQQSRLHALSGNPMGGPNLATAS